MAAEVTEGEMEVLPSHIESYRPRDLLRQFSGTGFLDEPTAAGGELGEIELSLGLSSGGCFGVEPKEERLVRSSSISTLSMFPIEHESVEAPPIARTSSLPAEIEEERRKRKATQSLKRLEAKRKRSEKLIFISGFRDRKEENLDEEIEPRVSKAELGGCPGFPGSTRIGDTVNGAVPYDLPRWGMGAGRAGGWPVDASRSYGSISQGSIGSQGSSSSGVSDFESRPMQALRLTSMGRKTTGGRKLPIRGRRKDPLMG